MKRHVPALEARAAPDALELVAAAFRGGRAKHQQGEDQDADR
jgi:hypothetical protein